MEQTKKTQESNTYLRYALVPMPSSRLYTLATDLIVLILSLLKTFTFLLNQPAKSQASPPIKPCLGAPHPAIQDPAFLFFTPHPNKYYSAATPYPSPHHQDEMKKMDLPQQHPYPYQAHSTPFGPPLPTPVPQPKPYTPPPPCTSTMAPLALRPNMPAHVACKLHHAPAPPACGHGTLRHAASPTKDANITVQAANPCIPNPHDHNLSPHTSQPCWQYHNPHLPLAYHS